MVSFVNEPIQFLGTFIIQFNRFSISFVNFLQRYQVSKIWLEIWLEWKLIPNSYLHQPNIKYQFRIFKVWSAMQFCSSKFGITHKLRFGVNFTNNLRASFVRKFCSKLFFTYILGLNFFWCKNIYANALIKWWEN